MLFLFTTIGIQLCCDPCVENIYVTRCPANGQARLAKAILSANAALFQSQPCDACLRCPEEVTSTYTIDAGQFDTMLSVFDVSRARGPSLRKTRSRGDFWFESKTADVQSRRCAASASTFASAALLRTPHPSKRNNLKKSVGSAKTCRASPKPASRPSSHHTAAVSGKSQVVTWCQIWSHSGGVNTLHKGLFVRTKRSSHAVRSSSAWHVG